MKRVDGREEEKGDEREVEKERERPRATGRAKVKEREWARVEVKGTRDNAGGVYV